MGCLESEVAKRMWVEVRGWESGGAVGWVVRGRQRRGALSERV